MSATLEASPYLRLLSPSSDEFGRIAELSAKSFPNECLIAVFVVDNPALSARYVDHAHTLAARAAERGTTTAAAVAPTEHTLWHGTSEQAAVAIVANGYRAELNKTSAYGRGTYFATAYAYSRDYASRTGDNVMLLNTVRVGVTRMGSGGATVPIASVDAFVDNVRTPHIFVIPDDDAALPTHVILFQTVPGAGQRDTDVVPAVARSSRRRLQGLRSQASKQNGAATRL